MRPENARSPMTFKRVIVTRPGGPEVLQLREEALPEPGPGEVRVKILAAGVSYADLLMREGVHPETPRTMPFTLGWASRGSNGADRTGIEKTWPPCWSCSARGRSSRSSRRGSRWKKPPAPMSCSAEEA